MSVITIAGDVIAVTFFLSGGGLRGDSIIGAFCLEPSKYSCAKVTKWGECLRGEFVAAAAAAVAAFVS